MLKKSDIKIYDFINKSDEDLIDLFQSWLNYGIKIDSFLGGNNNRFTMLHIATFSNRPKALSWLLEKKAKKNLKSDHGYTPLAYLTYNIYNKNQKEENWERFRQCLYLLIEYNVSFNIKNNDKQNPLFILLDYTKNKIPEDILQLFFSKTKLNKTTNELLSKLMFNIINFTTNNIEYLIKNKQIDLNSKNSKNSLAFLMPYLTNDEFKLIKNTLKEVVEKYSVNFSLTKIYTDNISKKRKVKPFECAINENSIECFKFILKQNINILNENCGNHSLINYCILTDFIYGIKLLIRLKKIDWNKNKELFDCCQNDTTRYLIKKEYLTFLNKKLNNELIIKENKKKKVKI